MLGAFFRRQDCALEQVNEKPDGTAAQCKLARCAVTAIINEGITHVVLPNGELLTPDCALGTPGAMHIYYGVAVEIPQPGEALD